LEAVDNLCISIFEVNESSFESVCMDAYHYQMKNNLVYHQYVTLLKKDKLDIHQVLDIPFLPISFFKSHKVTTEINATQYFESSGTNGMTQSKHYFVNLKIYEKSFLKAFKNNYGSPADFHIIGLLPSYLERSHSSLVYMVDVLMNLSAQPANGFYLNEFEKLKTLLLSLETSSKKVILFGVTYALLDFFESQNIQLNNTIIIETGGMKGRKKEMTSSEVSEVLSQFIPIQNLHNEFGMTELFSQSYAKGNGIYHPPAWKKIVVRDISDPLNVKKDGSGLLNIIDLANYYSCPFIATDDMGKVEENGCFEVFGRYDHSDARGCGLMYG
jgi:hypothetical protein